MYMLILENYIFFSLIVGAEEVTVDPLERERLHISLVLHILMNSDLFLTFLSSVKVQRLLHPNSTRHHFHIPESCISSYPYIQYIYAFSSGSFHHKSPRSIFIIFPMWQSVWQICGFESCQLVEVEHSPLLSSQLCLWNSDTVSRTDLLHAAVVKTIVWGQHCGLPGAANLANKPLNWELERACFQYLETRPAMLFMQDL